MEPVGAAASVVTLIGTAFTIAQSLHDLIASLRNAPKELLALSNEVSELSLILSSINQVANPPGSASRTATSQALVDCIQRAGEDLKELDTFTRGLIVTRTPTKIDVARLAWARHKKNASALQTRLREARINLNILFSASSMSGNSRIELSISELFNATSHYSDEQTLRNKHTSTLQTEHTSAINTLERAIQTSSDGQARYLEEASKERSRNSSTLSAILERTLPLKNLTKLHQDSTGIIQDILADDAERTKEAFGAIMKRVAPVDDIAEAQQKSMRLLHSILDIVTKGSSVHQRRDLENTACRNLNERGGDATGPFHNTIGVNITRSLEISCSVGCSCSCHIRQQIKSPLMLNSLVGSFFLGYTGRPTRFQACSEASCRGRSRFSAQLTYYFPQWFMMKMIAMVVARNAFGDFLFCPKVARVVPANSKIFSFVSTGDIAGIRTLFSKGLASPSDTRSGSGVTPLAYAIYCGRIEACKILLDEGSDPNYEDGTGMSPMSRAWTSILSKTLRKEHHLLLQTLFNDQDSLSERGLTVLQKIVLGLDKFGLEKELMRSTATINHVDSDGNTALSWAAQRKDSFSVELLLRYKANPNIYNKHGRGPLHLAAEQQSVKCMELLIQYQADIACADQWGLTPLLDACWENDKPSALYQLMKLGADPNVCATSGRNALAYSATRDHLAMAQHLIECGTSMNMTDNNGYSAAFIAVIYNSHRVLSLLLNSGADYSTKDKKRNTLLHVVADSGTLDTLNALSPFCLRNIDPAAENDNGLTAITIARTRFDMPDNPFLQAFAKLVKINVEGMPCGIHSTHVNGHCTLENANSDAADSTSNEEDSEPEFEDSLEYQLPYHRGLLYMGNTQVNLAEDERIEHPCFEVPAAAMHTSSQPPVNPASMNYGDSVSPEYCPAHGLSGLGHKRGVDDFGLNSIKDQDFIINRGTFSNDEVKDSLFTVEEVKLEPAITITDIVDE